MTDEPLALFPATDVPHGPPDPRVSRETSADRRRTARQYAAAARGVNPLALVVRTMRPHPDATPVDGPDDDRPGPRCGSCVHRGFTGAIGGRSFPKCLLDGPRGPRITYGPSTDVRAWWPACSDYSTDPTKGPVL